MVATAAVVVLGVPEAPVVLVLDVPEALVVLVLGYRQVLVATRRLDHLLVRTALLIVNRLHVR